MGHIARLLQGFNQFKILKKLLVSPPAVSETSELQICIPDFENLSKCRAEAVSSAFSKVFI